jgi:hypothetical protein
MLTAETCAMARRDRGLVGSLFWRWDVQVYAGSGVADYGVRQFDSTFGARSPLGVSTKQTGIHLLNPRSGFACCVVIHESAAPNPLQRYSSSIAVYVSRGYRQQSSPPHSRACDVVLAQASSRGMRGRCGGGRMRGRRGRSAAWAAGCGGRAAGCAAGALFTLKH